MRFQSLTIGVWIALVLLMTTSRERVIAQQQDRWIEDIGLQMTFQLPSPLVRHVYSLLLQSVRQALAEKNVSAIQQSMARLITMQGSKEGSISADTARSHLYMIGSRHASSVLDWGKKGLRNYFLNW